MSESVKAFLLLGAGMAVFGSGTPVSKIVTDAFPAFVASEVRMLLAAVVLTPLALAELRRSGSSKASTNRISRDDWVRLGAIALFGMVLFSVFMLYGMREVSGAIGSVVMATTPAVTAAGSVLFLRDRLDRWKAGAVAAAFAGVLAMNLGSTGSGTGDQIVLGSLLVFGAVCGEATYTLVGKRLTADLSPISVAAIASCLATVLFAAPAAVQLDTAHWSQAGAGDLLALLWWGLGTMALGSVLWYEGVRRVPGTTASAFMGVMPLSALLLSYLLLGESFEPIHAVGMIAVLAGIAAVTQSDRGARD